MDAPLRLTPVRRAAVPALGVHLLEVLWAGQPAVAQVFSLAQDYIYFYGTNEQNSLARWFRPRDDASSVVLDDAPLHEDSVDYIS